MIPPFGTLELDQYQEQRKTYTPATLDCCDFIIGTQGLAGLTWSQIATLAAQAKGSWTSTDATGTSVEIVRRLRDEWDQA